MSAQKGRPIARPTQRRPGRRLLVAAVALPVLYVLSSGPALSFAFTWHQPTLQDEGDDNLGVTVNLDEGPWWPVVYAPLQWISEQDWGEWLCWYWELFPISADRHRPASTTRTREEAAFHRPTPAIRLEPAQKDEVGSVALNPGLRRE